MPHVFEVAPSGRSKCRGCSRTIERGTLRFGESLANPFAEGEMKHWYHPVCAAYKRAEPLLEALGDTTDVSDKESLERLARHSLSHRRLPRINGAEQSPTSQAKCRHCRQPIERGSWRIRLVFYEEGLFAPGGFVHLHCSADYFEIRDIVDQVLHFSSDLSPSQLEELRLALSG
jgi:Poly(ADP-ribose) polymerase and DNA-Ligase Zn-finger region